MLDWTESIVITSSLIYIYIYDACIQAQANGNLHESNKLSDHLVVSACFRTKEIGCSARSVPSWVCKHPHFSDACEEAANEAPFGEGSPVEEVLWAKQIMHNAARKVVATTKNIGAKTIPEQLHWACTFLRALRTGNHELAIAAANASSEL